MTRLPGWLMERNDGRYDRKRQASALAVDQRLMNEVMKRKQAKR